MDKKHVVIVGAGPGGLASAMILAHRGFKVTVFEKASQVGGRNAPIQWGGFTWDTGPTFLMMSFVLKELFEETERSVEDYLQFERLDPLYRLTFPEVEINLPADRAKLKDEIAEKFSRSDAAIDRFFSREAKRFERLFPCLQKPYSSLLTLPYGKLLRALPHISFPRSIMDNLSQYFDQEALRLCFTFQSKYLGMSPWTCPALFTMIPYIEHAYGIYHVTGGLNQISLAMAKVLEEQGVELHTDTPVAKLITDGRTVTGVKLEDGTSVHADDVVINADFCYAMSNLVEPGLLKKHTEEKLRKKRLTCSTFMMYLAVDTVYDAPHHNIVFADDYRSNLEDIFDRKVLSEDISFYVQNACVTDPSLAPAGASTIYVLLPVPNNQSQIDWAEHKEAVREKVLDSLAKRAGMTDIRQHIKHEKIITPAEWEQDYNVYEAAEFSLSPCFSQLLYFRPRNKFEELRHCYLVGGGTHPGSGLPTIYESARISSNLLCKSYGIAYREPSPLPGKQVITAAETRR